MEEGGAQRGWREMKEETRRKGGSYMQREGEGANGKEKGSI